MHYDLTSSSASMHLQAISVLQLGSNIARYFTHVASLMKDSPPPCPTISVHRLPPEAPATAPHSPLVSLRLLEHAIQSTSNDGRFWYTPQLARGCDVILHAGTAYPASQTTRRLNAYRGARCSCGAENAGKRAPIRCSFWNMSARRPLTSSSYTPHCQTLLSRRAPLLIYDYPHLC